MSMNKKPTDPGGKAYFDSRRSPKSTEQRPKSGEMSASSFSLKDALYRIKSDLTTEYVDETKRLKKAAEIFVPGFTEGFVKKIASLTHEQQQDIFSNLFATGMLKLSSMMGNSVVGAPPAKPMAQSYAKQQFNLGSQTNMLGKQMPLGPDGQRQEMPTASQTGIKQINNPLTDLLPKAQTRMSIPQLKAVGN